MATVTNQAQITCTKTFNSLENRLSVLGEGKRATHGVKVRAFLQEHALKGHTIHFIDHATTLKLLAWKINEIEYRFGQNEFLAEETALVLQKDNTATIQILEVEYRQGKKTHTISFVDGPGSSSDERIGAVAQGLQISSSSSSSSSSTTT